MLEEYQHQQNLCIKRLLSLPVSPNSRDITQLVGILVTALAFYTKPFFAC